MSEMVERVARAIARVQSGKLFREECTIEQLDGFGYIAAARAAIEAMPLEQLIREAYVRGVDWANENVLDQEYQLGGGYRFKASADYADRVLSALQEQEQGR